VSDSPPFDIRPFNPDKTTERNLILSSWMSSIRRLHPWGTHGPEEFAKSAHRPVEELLDAEPTNVLIACNPKDREHIFGYCVSDGSADFFVLHMVYVTKHWRGYGIATRLVFSAFPELGKLPFVYTTHTPVAGRLKDRFDGRHNMFLLHPFYRLPEYR
jgi:hypothetical protein